MGILSIVDLYAITQSQKDFANDPHVLRCVQNDVGDFFVPKVELPQTDVTQKNFLSDEYGVRLVATIAILNSCNCFLLHYPIAYIPAEDSDRCR